MPNANASITITAQHSGAKPRVEEMQGSLRGVGKAATAGAAEATKAMQGVGASAVVQREKLTALERKVQAFEAQSGRTGARGIQALIERQNKAIAQTRALGGGEEAYARVVAATIGALEKKEAAFVRLSAEGRKSVEKLFRETAAGAKLADADIERLNKTLDRFKTAAQVRDAGQLQRAGAKETEQIARQAQERAKQAVLARKTAEEQIAIEERSAVRRAQAAGATEQQIQRIVAAFGIQKRAAAEAARETDRALRERTVKSNAAQVAREQQQAAEAQRRATEQASKAIDNQTAALEKQAAVAGKTGAERVRIERQIALEAARAGGASTAQLRRMSAAYDQLEAAARRGGVAVRGSGEAMAAAGLEAAALAVGLKTLIVDTATYGARVQTQGVALQQVARANNVSAAAIDTQTDALKRLGISTEATQKVLAQFAVTGLPIDRIQELAGLSRDLAVIMGEDTSDAMTRLTRAIVTQEVEILRTLGLNVKFEDGLNRLARSLNKTVGELTYAERNLANFNTVTSQAPRFQGTYEASLLTVGKQLTTLTRLTNEAKLELSGAFLPALGTVVGGLSDLTKNIRENAAEWRILATVLGTATTAVLAWRSAALLQLAIFGATKGWIGAVVAVLAGLTAGYLATRTEADLMRDSLERNLDSLKDQETALKGSGLAAAQMARELERIGQGRAVLDAELKMLDLDDAIADAQKRLATLLKTYTEFNISSPATQKVVDNLRDNILDLRTARLAVQSELDALQKAAATATDVGGGDEISEKIKRDLESARKLYEQARLSELSTAQRIREILKERVREMGSSAAAIDLIGRTAAIELRAEVKKTAEDMRKALEGFGKIAQDEQAKALRARLQAEAQTLEELARLQAQGVEQLAQIEAGRIARSRDLALSGLRDTANLTVREKVAVEQRKLEIEIRYLQQSAELEAANIKRTTQVAISEHQIRLGLIQAELQARIAAIQAQEAEAVASAQARQASDPEIARLRQTFQAARSLAERAEQRQIEGIRAVTDELIGQEQRALEALSEQTGDAILTAQRNTAATQAEIVASHNQRIFDNLKRSAEGVFDSLTRSSQGFFESLGNLLKTAMLTSIKEIVTSRVAMLLSGLFGGGSFGVQPQGGREGGGLLGGLLGGFGGFGRPGAPGGTGGFAGPVVETFRPPAAVAAGASQLSQARSRELVEVNRLNDAHREGLALAEQRLEAERDAARASADAAAGRFVATERLAEAQGKQAQEFDASARRQERATMALGQRITGLLGAGGLSAALAVAGGGNLPLARGSAFSLQSLLTPAIGSIARPGAPGGTGGFGGPVGGQGGGGLGGLLTSFGQQAAGLREFLNLGNSLQLGPGLATTFGAASIGQKLTALGRSDAALLGGGLLFANGLRQGGIGGLAQTTAGGALAGFKFGGPIGALIGGGIGAGAGILRLFVKGAEQKAREKIKAAYGYDVQDKQILQQVVQTAKSSFGGNIDMAIRSPQIRDLLELYAMHRGETFGGAAARQLPVSLVQRGGALSQQAVFSGGRAFTTESRLPTISPGRAAGANGVTVLKLDGEATTRLWRGEFVNTVEENPRIVQNAALKSARGQFGRRQMAALNMEPQVLER